MPLVGLSLGDLAPLGHPRSVEHIDEGDAHDPRDVCDLWTTQPDEDESAQPCGAAGPVAGPRRSGQDSPALLLGKGPEPPSPKGDGGPAAPSGRRTPSADLLNAKRLADAWCAAFVQPKTVGPGGPEGPGITHATLTRLQADPTDLDPHTAALIDRVAREHRFFH